MEQRQEHQEAPNGRLEAERQGVFQNAFDAAANGIAIEDMDGRPLFANPALCHMLGFSEDEMRNKHCVEFSPPEDAKLDWALFEQLRQGSIDKYHLEKRFYRKDGSLFWGRLSISLMANPAGSAPLVVAMVEDITEKRIAEEKLTKSEESLHHLASRLIQAQEEERRRIGQDLHDDIGQRLSLLVVGLEQLRESLTADQNGQSQLASELQSRADEVATDIHDLSRALHSAKLQFLGLNVALQNLCDRTSAQHRVAVTLEAAGIAGRSALRHGALHFPRRAGGAQQRGEARPRRPGRD